jgi:hypothetical protein
VAETCEHGNDTSGSIKGREFIDHLSGCQILKQNSAACSYKISRY